MADIINSLLEPDYKKRLDIYQIYKFLKEELNINNKYSIDEIKNEINNEINNMNINNKFNMIVDEDSIDEIENEVNNININNKVNIIKGEIYINEDDINKDIRIINSFENAKRENYWGNEDDDWKYENEKEIKENIEIKINEKIIEFTYYYKFNKQDKYIIEYSFKNNLTKTCFMFYECSKLIDLNLSDFNTENVINMGGMFYKCESLAIINFKKKM